MKFILNLKGQSYTEMGMPPSLQLLVTASAAICSVSSYWTIRWLCHRSLLLASYIFLAANTQHTVLKRKFIFKAGCKLNRSVTFQSLDWDEFIFLFLCLHVNPDSWQLQAYTDAVLLEKFSEVVCQDQNSVLVSSPVPFYHCTKVALFFYLEKYGLF